MPISYFVFHYIKAMLQQKLNNHAITITLQQTITILFSETLTDSGVRKLKATTVFALLKTPQTEKLLTV